jgi:hypothetical protein
MSLRFSLAAAAALIGISVLTAPASATMQVIQLPDPSAANLNSSAPDGLFDKSFSDHWQKPSTDGQSGKNSFHFTMTGSSSGASSGFSSTSSPSAIDTSKQPGSEFYQPMQGSPYPYYYGH